jgi:hypothetical protein
MKRIINIMILIINARPLPRSLHPSIADQAAMLTFPSRNRFLGQVRIRVKQTVGCQPLGFSSFRFFFLAPLGYMIITWWKINFSLSSICFECWPRLYPVTRYLKLQDLDQYKYIYLGIYLSDSSRSSHDPEIVHFSSRYSLAITYLLNMFTRVYLYISFCNNGTRSSALVAKIKRYPPLQH